MYLGRHVSSPLSFGSQLLFHQRAGTTDAVVVVTVVVIVVVTIVETVVDAIVCCYCS